MPWTANGLCRSGTGMGPPIREKEVDQELVKDAHARWRLEDDPPPESEGTSSHTVYDICKAYLYDVQVNGSEKTLADRLDTLFDVCWGLPPEYRAERTLDPKLSERKRAEKRRIHPGYGHLAAMSLTFIRGRPLPRAD